MRTHLDHPTRGRIQVPSYPLNGRIQPLPLVRRRRNLHQIRLNVNRLLYDANRCDGLDRRGGVADWGGDRGCQVEGPATVGRAGVRRVVGPDGERDGAGLEGDRGGRGLG